MSDERVPQLLLERLAKDELPETKKHAVLARLEREPGGMERLAELEASDQAILAELPPARFRAALDASLGGGRGRARWLAIALPTAALASAVLALLPLNAPEAPEIEETRLKGDGSPGLGVLRGDARLTDGDAARAGDRLSFVVRAPRPIFGVLLAVDGEGTVTLIEPPAAGPALRIEPGRPLPSSYELDDAPRFERFFLVSGPEPFNVGPVIDAAMNWSGGALVLPAGLAQDSFEVKKAP